MKGLVFLSIVVVPGLLAHLCLFGFHRAPVNAVRLSRRQWVRVGLIVAPLVVAIVLGIVATRQPTFAHGSEWPLDVAACSLFSLVGVVFGMAPSFGEEGPDAGNAARAGKGHDTA